MRVYFIVKDKNLVEEFAGGMRIERENLFYFSTIIYYILSTRCYESWHMLRKFDYKV